MADFTPTNLLTGCSTLDAMKDVTLTTNSYGSATHLTALPQQCVLDDLPSWVTLTERITGSNHGVPFNTIVTPLRTVPALSSHKAPVVAAVVAALDADTVDPWTLSVTLKDPSGELDACIHAGALRRYPALREIGTAVLLRDVTVYRGVCGLRTALIVCAETVVATCALEGAAVLPTLSITQHPSPFNSSDIKAQRGALKRSRSPVDTEQQQQPHLPLSAARSEDPWNAFLENEGEL